MLVQKPMLATLFKQLFFGNGQIFAFFFIEIAEESKLKIVSYG